MPPKPTEGSGISLPNEQRKRPSEDDSATMDVETGSPTKKPRILPDATSPAIAAASAPSADGTFAIVSGRYITSSSSTLSGPGPSSQPPSLRLATDVGIMESSPPSLTGSDEQADSPPTPSPRTPHLDLPENLQSVAIPHAPTILAVTASLATMPPPAVPNTDRPQLDKDLLATQIQESAGPDKDPEDSRLTQALKNVEITKAAYELADRAMEAAREKNITARGDTHMSEIMRRALARLRAAKEKQKEIEKGDSDKLDAEPQPAVSDDARDDHGNVWCLEMAGTSLKNQCCSDCEIV